jgi:glycosyltransferase involved in cell wall biosynthesis
LFKPGLFLKKVLLITSGQPALNPRLVKEADCLTDSGYAVTVLYQYWNEWGTKLDKDLLKTKKWRALRVGGSPTEEIFIFNFTKLIHKICKTLFFYCGVKAAAIGAIARSSFFLIMKAKKIKADFYIGHNLGALPATVIAANFHKKKCGFDAEDFHRHEVSDAPNHPDVKLKRYLEEQFFSHLSYLSAASPLISEEYKMLFPTLNIRTILNAFPKKKNNNITSTTSTASLKLFWFSQTIGTNRGVQDIIKAIKLLEAKKIELHLYGFLPQDSMNTFDKLIEELNFAGSPNIYFHEPVPEEELLNLALGFDIGFAIEPGFCFNNKIALSNKIFTYLFGGCAIVFSNTPAQFDFYNRNKNIGCIYDCKDINALTTILSEYYCNRQFLREHQANSRRLFEEDMNWESESKKFIGVIESILN